ncbi:MAG: hypothetical protein V3V00_10300, partial [Saprospiraceae bacterium]
ELSNGAFRRRYFSSGKGGKTGVMPLHNEDFPNVEQKIKNKYKCLRFLSETTLHSLFVRTDLCSPASFRSGVTTNTLAAY